MKHQVFLMAEEPRKPMTCFSSSDALLTNLQLAVIDEHVILNGSLGLASLKRPSQIQQQPRTSLLLSKLCHTSAVMHEGRCSANWHFENTAQCEKMPNSLYLCHNTHIFSAHVFWIWFRVESLWMRYLLSSKVKMSHQTEKKNIYILQVKPKAVWKVELYKITFGSLWEMIMYYMSCIVCSFCS